MPRPPDPAGLDRALRERTGLSTVGAAVDEFMAHAEHLLSSIDWDAQDARVAAERERDAQSVERDRMFARLGRMASAGFPERALEVARMADVNAAFTSAISDKLGDSRVCALAGTVGSGKTVAATWWALTQTDLAPAFVRATTFAASSRYQGERQDWLSAGVLVLDDLGSEYMDAKGSLLTDLDELVDVFYGSLRRRLIITTNLTAAGFKTKYGDRIVSRMRDAGVWIELDAPSLRRGAR